MKLKLIYSKFFKESSNTSYLSFNTLTELENKTKIYKKLKNF